MNKTGIQPLMKFWLKKQAEIESRLKHFYLKQKNSTPKEIFKEFVFCLFTPQSKAKSCWKAVETLADKNLLQNGSQKE